MTRRFPIHGLVVAVLGGTFADSAKAENGLSYRLTTGQVFGYEVTIEAQRDAYTHAMKGNTIYTVAAADANEIKVACVGNVAPKTIPKAGSRTVGRPGGRPSPLSSVTAYSRTTNQIAIDPTGKVLSLRGESQLPYLLGHLSLLPLEHLPGDERNQWTVKTATGVTESGGRRPGPRALSNNDKQTAASEELVYRITDRNSSEIAIEKTYTLSSGEQADGAPRFQISGKGKLVLDARDNLPKSMKFAQTVTSVKESVTTTVPLTISYRRLSEDEIAAVQQQWKDNLAAAKEKFAERQEKNSQPLSEEDRDKILADLKSDNVAFLMRSLQKLKRRPATPDDEETKSALKALLNHKNPGVKRSAADVWAKWSAAD
jgi:hypothetical protein